MKQMPLLCQLSYFSRVTEGGIRTRDLWINVVPQAFADVFPFDSCDWWDQPRAGPTRPQHYNRIASIVFTQ